MVGCCSFPLRRQRRRLQARLLLLACGLAAPSAEAAVTWKADFEPGNLSQFSNGAQNARDIEFVSDPVQEGKVAGKFTMRANDTFGGSQMRVLINHTGARTGEGQDVFMSFYFRIETDPLIRDNIAYWETNGSFRNMMTWWLAPKAGGGTTLNFGTGNLGSTKHILTTDVTVKAWHQLAFHVHWSRMADVGNIVVWLDGTKVVDEHAQTKPDGNALFFQAGIHRANRSPLVDSVYFDNFLEGESTADIMLADGVPGPTDGGAVSQDAAKPADAPRENPVTGTTGSGGSGGSEGGEGVGGAGATTPLPDAGAVPPAGPGFLDGGGSCAVSRGSAPPTAGLLVLALLLASALRPGRRR